ncbi:MAG: S8 family serine peptidase [Frankiaceae bacterium]
MLYAVGAGSSAARAAVVSAGGTVVRDNVKVGYAIVRSADASFADRVAKESALGGAARNRPIGYAPTNRPKGKDLERLASARTFRTGTSKAVQQGGVIADPLADRQWDMPQIGATPGGSYAVQPGSKKVMVGVIDTGIDGTHPDIKANFDAQDSRNFTTDIPSLDGPCEFAGCKDPANWDDDGHGTHVASTIGSPINGRGIAGVAPNVTLVNLRAGQDAGYFFLQPTLDALTYAGDLGVDVVNMSFYTDPWLFNCRKNPADSPQEQREQRTVRVATQRAMNYALSHGVAPFAAAGNEATDLSHPTVDETSPDYPPGSGKHRDITNGCITVPTETNGVNVVSSTGFSTRKAYYSNYGTEQIDVAAPGGDVYDSPDNTRDVRLGVLAAYPTRLAKLSGAIDAHGNPTTDAVVKDCSGGTCAYYQYLQGTSMASPHATGVGALIVSEYGHNDPAHPGGLTLNPGRTRSILQNTAVEHACPQPRLFPYKRYLLDGTVNSSSAYCAGPTTNNGFYGSGIVNALAAVR